jgi:primosomal protein DnaI
LYLTGAFGRGKTFLLCYLLRELAELGYTGVILHMPQFVEEVKGLVQDPAALREWTETLKQADVLMFDDIGSENLTPWVRDHILGAILTSRMNHKPTFYSSNYSVDDLGKLLSFTAKEGEDLHKGQRLMERIRNYVKVVHVKGSNMREQQAKSMISGTN